MPEVSLSLPPRRSGKLEILALPETAHSLEIPGLCSSRVVRLEGWVKIYNPPVKQNPSPSLLPTIMKADTKYLQDATRSFQHGQEAF